MKKFWIIGVALLTIIFINIFSTSFGNEEMINENSITTQSNNLTTRKGYCEIFKNTFGIKFR